MLETPITSLALCSDGDRLGLIMSIQWHRNNGFVTRLLKDYVSRNYEEITRDALRICMSYFVSNWKCFIFYLEVLPSISWEKSAFKPIALSKCFGSVDFRKINKRRLHLIKLFNSWTACWWLFIILWLGPYQINGQ